MKSTFKKILIIVLSLCLFQASFYITRAEEEKINVNENESNDSYAINITQPYGGDVFTDPAGEASEYEEVTISVEPFEGYVLQSIQVMNDSTQTVVPCTNNVFTMPASSVTITAVFVKVTYYNVQTILTDGGDLVLYNADGGKAAAGNVVSIEYKPWEGYQADYTSTIIKDSSNNDVPYVVDTSGSTTLVRFTMPESNVTITPTFSLIPGYEFSIDTSSVPEGATITFYKENSGSWVEITDGKFVGGTNLKYVITFNPGFSLRRVLITYINKRTGKPVTLNKSTGSKEGTFTSPYASISTSINVKGISHCAKFSADEQTCDVCEAGYERSEDGKKCTQGSPSDFATDDWIYVNDCALNPSTCPYSVGDTREITVNGTTYLLRIANMDTKPACTATSGYSQTACGFVVEFVKCIKEMDMNVDVSTNKRSTNGSWTTTDVYKYLTDTFLPLLKENVVKQGSTKLGSVMIPTLVITGSNYGEKESTGRTTHRTDNLYLYLLSLHEVYEGTATEKKNDIDYTVASMDNGYSKTHQLQFYEGLKTTDDANVKANIVYKESSTGGSGRDWWLRTPSNQKENNSTHYYCVSQMGGAGYKRALSNISGYGTATGMTVVPKGIAPAFRIGNKYYNIVVESSTGGTVTTNPSTKALKGYEVAITATPEEGYVLDSISVVKTGSTTVVPVSDNKFTMPGYDVTVTATFRES